MTSEQSRPPLSASANIPVAASLENPLYYLENADTVVRWTLAQHSDLLLVDEAVALGDFLALPAAPRALLVRMITRTRDLFRLEQLHYEEIPAPVESAVATLAAGGWVNINPALTVPDLCQLLRKEELFHLFKEELASIGLGKHARKADMEAVLSERHPDASRTAQKWGIPETETPVSLTVAPLFERIRLMFFGNLHQTWSEFVVTELGHLRYETVHFSTDSRAFQSRAEVDAYLELHRLGQLLEVGEPPEKLWQDSPRSPLDNPWLDNRRRRFLHRLGREAERRGNIDIALEVYQAAWDEESRIRYFRVVEKQTSPDTFLGALVSTCTQSSSASEQQLLCRIIKRADKSHPLANAFTPSGKWATDAITLHQQPHLSVEQQVALHYSTSGSHCYYVENTLFNSLLGLLLWPALFAPVPGAFFHPFQSGPADLFREDFVARRQFLIDECFSTLEDGGYRTRIFRQLDEKKGISCPLVYWPLMTADLVESVLASIPAEHLKAIFQRLLADLKKHRSGFPDLIRLWPGQQRYELIEVKGPGDRLQDHQKLWLDYFIHHGIPARVCQVSWEESP